MKKPLFLFTILFLALGLNAEPLMLFYTNDTHGTYQPEAIKTVAGIDSVEALSDYLSDNGPNRLDAHYDWVGLRIRAVVI